MIDLGQVTEKEAVLIVESLRMNAHSHSHRRCMLELASALSRRAGTQITPEVAPEQRPLPEMYRTGFERIR